MEPDPYAIVGGDPHDPYFYDDYYDPYTFIKKIYEIHRLGGFKSLKT